MKNYLHELKQEVHEEKDNQENLLFAVERRI
jgi:hypothetical protein